MAPQVLTRPAWRCNLAEILLDDQLARAGGRPALRSPDRVYSYDDLASLVAPLAGGLAEFGVGPGRRVALVLADSPLWVATFLALTRLGAVVALASPAIPRERLRDALDRAGPSLLCGDDHELLPATPSLDSLALSGIAEAGARDPGPASTRRTDPGYMLLTTGTTGPPKWAVHRHADIPACLATYGRHVLGLRPDDVSWSVAALPTSYGLGNSLYFPLGAGASSWITGAPPSPAEAVRACAEGGATVVFGVPTFWARLARHVAERRLPAAVFGGVRLGVSAGEPLPSAVWFTVRDALGLELVDGLGSSEATNLYLSNRPGRARPGSIGSAVPGFQLRVAGENGQRPADGIPGELLVRGASIMTGYLDAPEATGRAIREGWLHTGDLVVQRPDATFRFVGRLGERFKTGGFWVDPVRVEEVLHAHPAIAEVAILGTPDADGVIRVTALVVARGGVDGVALCGELEELAKAQLASHEVPRDVIFVDRLPTTASGKVRRSDLPGIASEAMKTPLSR